MVGLLQPGHQPAVLLSSSHSGRRRLGSERCGLGRCRCRLLLLHARRGQRAGLRGNRLEVHAGQQLQLLLRAGRLGVQQLQLLLCAGSLGLQQLHLLLRAGRLGLQQLQLLLRAGRLGVQQLHLLPQQLVLRQQLGVLILLQGVGLVWVGVEAGQSRCHQSSHPALQEELLTATGVGRAACCS